MATKREPEPHDDQIARVEMMADGGEKWDLSPNDLAALRTVLDERAALLSALKEIHEPCDGGEDCYTCPVIAKAEGR